MSDASTTRPRRRWLQFGLRTLFVFVTLAAFVSYLLVRPTILAQQFCEAITAEDYERAESLLVIKNPDMRIFPANVRLKLATAKLKPLTRHDLLNRQRIVWMNVLENGGGWESAAVVFTWWGGKITIRMT